jgi:23S rRNA pseudouridine1911/1915/1917 synthase
VNEVVPAALDGERVDRIVAMLTGVSRAAAAALVAGGAVRVDGEPVASGKHRLHEGQVVELPDSGPIELAPAVAEPSVAVDVVSADDDVIVVNKPAGLVVHPGAGKPGGTLVNGLLARFPDLDGVGVDPQRPGIVHRLDAETSGVLVVARSARAYESLVAQLTERTAGREYVALAWGEPEARHGAVDAPIGRSAREPTRMAVSASGRPARTIYQIQRVFDDPVPCSLWRCRLESGRTHQIRVHLASIGHPVVGDARYGGVRPGLEVPRLMLHAETLTFDHPVTGERLRFDAPVPDDMAAVLSRLR